MELKIMFARLTFQDPYTKKKLDHLSGLIAWKSIPGLAENVLTFMQRLPIPYQRKMSIFLVFWAPIL
jgi:hypothetical protein